MFTVKATYKGETRKFSLSTDEFPTFEQLCNHLYRVFPISHNFYISRLLFSPNVTQGGRILIGREVRTQDDYDKSIEPYNQRRWPHALLKFSVHDETSYKSSDTTQASPSRTPHFWSYPPGGHSCPVSMLSTPCISPPNTALPKPPIVKTAEPDKVMDGVQKACCSVQSAREDVQRLIADFKHDLDNILVTNFTSKQIVSQSPLLPSSSPAPSAAGHNSDGSPLCSVCARGKQRSWIVCDYCHVVECKDCSGKAPSFCLGTMGTHRWRQSSVPPVVTPWSTTLLPGQKSWNLDSSLSVLCATSTDPQTPCGRTPVAPFIPPPMAPAISREDSPRDTPQPRAIVHHGILCDGCQNTVIGLRHKCLDCPDYDLCGNCVFSGSKDRHNPCHEFFEVTEPSRVVVHRMHERPALRDQDRNAHQAAVEIVAHHATCDLCDSRIEGDRYKCLDCPDFDTCSTCFSIMEIQHPGHGFARLRRPEDFIERRRSNNPSTHYASCNICARRIHGVRYKCMHHDCPDFDLCDICEAHPIALHPKNHPLLKMKTPEILVSSILPQETLSFNSLGDAQPEEVNCDRHQLIPVPPEPSSSFVWGYMHASTFSNESVLRTPVVQPKLIPRLDEISPSLIRVPLEEERSRASPIEGVGRNDTWSVLSPYDEKKVKECPENRTNTMRLSKSVKYCHDPGCLESETTWPATAAELAHLMPPVEPSLHCDMSIQLEQGPQVSPDIGFVPSPLTGEEALLSAPVEVASSDMQQKSVTPVTVSRQTLAMLLGEQESSSKFELSSVVSLEEEHPMLSSLKVGTSESGRQLQASSAEVEYLQSRQEKDGQRTIPISERVEQLAPKKDIQEFNDEVYLSAMFVEDVTVSDGQVFPPGAEFMKCWRMLNDSGNDWPETTKLVYVAGEMFGTNKDVAVFVGLVKSGSEIELWTGELKAPDVAGRYVSYWRLRNAEGVLFGDSIWIDIVVADAHSSDESDKSMASSLVIMPQSVHTDTSGQFNRQGITTIEGGNQVQGRGANTLISGTLTVGTLTLPSSSSGIGSDADSEVSILSIPSSDGEMWEDVASQVGDATSGQSQGQAIDYVLLYDDRSSEDE